MQELKGVAEAEVRSIDLWNIRFEADKCLYLEDDIPAALSIKELKSEPFSLRHNSNGTLKLPGSRCVPLIKNHAVLGDMPVIEQSCRRGHIELWQ